MQPPSQPWDYLIVTASNRSQAAAYEHQLDLRRRLGLLSQVRHVVVLPDPDGRRIGSGASTALCLMDVLRRECPPRRLKDRASWLEALGSLRILIMHAGGDSRRLPAYGPCGKIFVPVPGASDSAVATTLFDRQLPLHLALPPGRSGAGQVVLTAGDVLLLLDPQSVRLEAPGVIGLGCPNSPQEAAGHGVYCTDADGAVRRFLQKPSPAEQARQGAVDRFGRTVLDVGVFQLDAGAAVELLLACGAAPRGGALAWTGAMGRAIQEHGLDFYREFCCAMGRQTRAGDHRAACRASGCRLDDSLLSGIYDRFHRLPFSVQVLGRCNFLHFGTSRHLVASGHALRSADLGVRGDEGPLVLSSQIAEALAPAGADSWVEGCRLHAPLRLAGWNLVVGVDVERELALPHGACLDVLTGRTRQGGPAWFVRCYHVDDDFKARLEQGARFCGRRLEEWLAQVGAGVDDVWPAGQNVHDLWTARLFVACESAQGYREWLWMHEPSGASPEQKQAYLAAPRYSLAEMADLADPQAFHDRRAAMRSIEVRHSLRRLFRLDSGLSADDLAGLLARADDRAAWLAPLIGEARWYYGTGRSGDSLEFITFSRILHTLGSALLKLAGPGRASMGRVVPGLARALAPADRDWLESLHLLPARATCVERWAQRAHELAFEWFGRSMLASAPPGRELPRSSLRSDEIVWGRAPARLDFGGGWTDTPPYALEYGGSVINAAINLNAQPPIQVYARVIAEPVIRIASIDLGQRLEIRDLEHLLDYRQPESSFALAKAALAMSGLAPDLAPWPAGTSLKAMLGRFGGGIELTTLAAIPKGSGLGTSSIMGAVTLAVIQRVMGRTLTPTELFNGVLRLEQALTTGGGWQDQVGGAVAGVKLITTQPGLRPDVRVHFVPDDVLDNRANGGCSLLYYTGITRLAKNILQKVVGRYLDRERGAMSALAQLRAISARVADAMARKDLPAYGALVAQTWQLNKQLDPDSTNPEVDRLLERIAPHAHGAKLLGAGGGGFLMILCKSASDAAAVRALLEADPPNDRARFFDFEISRQGLVVTVC